VVQTAGPQRSSEKKMFTSTRELWPHSSPCPYFLTTCTNDINTKFDFGSEEPVYNCLTYTWNTQSPNIYIRAADNEQSLQSSISDATFAANRSMAESNRASEKTGQGSRPEH